MWRSKRTAGREDVQKATLRRAVPRAATETTGGNMHDEHARCVDGWLDRYSPRTKSEALDALDAALQAIWLRASVAIGEAALATTLSTVLRRARQHFSGFDAVTVTLTGAQVDRARGAQLDARELLIAVRYVLIEFLRLIGTLNAEVLTGALHHELSYVSPVSGTTRAVSPLLRGRGAP